MTQKREAATLPRVTATNKKACNNNNLHGAKGQDNSAENQRARILDWLKSKPLTTLQARHKLDIMHPGMRICELRKAGHQIITVWVDDLTAEGFSHRVGQYILLSKKQLSLLDLPGVAKTEVA